MVGIKDVAAAAGVSVGTVSNVLNRPSSVSPATRRRVESVIRRLHYVRNESARQLRTGSSRTIALVVLDVTNPFFADVVAGAEQAAEAEDALVVVCNSGGDVQRELRHLQRLEAQRVMGVLLSPVDTASHPQVQALEASGVPVVVVDRVATSTLTPSVAVDDVTGGRLAGEHLVRRGHRRVAYLGGPPHLQQVRDRLVGFQEGCRVDGVEVVRQVTAPEMSVPAGGAALEEVLGGRPVDRGADGGRHHSDHDHPRPDESSRTISAVFCANDLLAIGVLNEALRRGLRVPQDLAIIGYDDIEYSATTAVPLTSIHQPRRELGRTGVEMLLAQVAGLADDEPRPPRQVTFTPHLVARESTGLDLPSSTAPVEQA